MLTTEGDSFSARSENVSGASNALTDPVIASLMRQTGRGKTSADGKSFTFTIDELGQLYDEYEAWKETLNE